MLTNLQKLKILQNLLCLVAVNAVYNSGQQCNKEGKEKKVFAIFEAELALFAEQKGRWSAMKEFTPMECPRDQIRQATKNSPLTSEKIWERGMTMRRDLVNWLSEYGKILNFTLIKPIVDENDDTEQTHPGKPAALYSAPLLCSSCKVGIFTTNGKTVVLYHNINLLKKHRCTSLLINVCSCKSSNVTFLVKILNDPRTNRCIGHASLPLLSNLFLQK
jgi:hypothetical protein